MTVYIVLRSGQYLDLVKTTITDRIDVLGVFTTEEKAEQVMNQARSQAWVGVTESWMEERIIDALGPEHDALCEMDRQIFCNCWSRTDLLNPRTPILQKAN